jgi:hypothetical protein
MKTPVQPCSACVDLRFETSAAEPHKALSINGIGAVMDLVLEEHYTCMTCRSAFARVLAGPHAGRMWLLLNVGLLREHDRPD